MQSFVDESPSRFNADSFSSASLHLLWDHQLSPINCPASQRASPLHIESIAAWWKGEISGKRCLPNVISAGSTIGGGLIGEAVGTWIGTCVFPGVGTLVGGIAGGVVGSSAAGALSKYLTEYFFGLPPTVALENAYKFLDLKPSCTNTDINVKFKQLALRYHPNKGGSNEDFHKLQISVAIIKQTRGQDV